MTLKERFIALKAALIAIDFADTPPSTPPASGAPAMIQDTLDDGTPVQYSKLEIGGDIQVTGPDGSMVPAPIADYELASGTMVTVTEVGKIAAIIPNGEVPADDATEMKKAIATMKAEFTASITAQSVLITAQAKLITDLKTELTAFKTGAGGVITQLSAAVEDLANSETGRPAGTPRETVLSQKAKELEEKKAKASNAFQQFAESLKAKN